MNPQNTPVVVCFR